MRNALLLAGAVGIVIAGFVGWWAVRNAVRPLGQALALQRRFIADAGHELRTPPTILHTRAQLLARRIHADDPARPTVDQWLDDSRVLAEIVEELLASASLTEDPSRAEPVDTADLANDVATSMAVLAQAAGVELRTRTAAGVIVSGSRTALRRALVALTDNAVAHMVDAIRRQRANRPGTTAAMSRPQALFPRTAPAIDASVAGPVIQL